MDWQKQDPAVTTFTSTDSTGVIWALELTTTPNGKTITLKKSGTSQGVLTAPDMAFIKTLFGQVSAQL